MRDDNGGWLGHDGTECGEHRTVGPHRAWCFACAEWCYPDAPCRRCETRPGEIQTRSHGGDCRSHPTVSAAFEHAKANPDVWKVSFPIPGEGRARFVRVEWPGRCDWKWEPMEDAIAAAEAAGVQTREDQER